MSTLSLHPSIIAMDGVYLNWTGKYAATPSKLFEVVGYDKERFGHIGFNDIQAQWQLLLDHRNQQQQQGIWAWRTDTGDYQPYPSKVCQDLENANVGDKIAYISGSLNFTITKDSRTTATQYNQSTGGKRSVQRQSQPDDAPIQTSSISNSNAAVVWQFEADDGSYVDCDPTVTQHLENWSPGQYNIKISSHVYGLDKLDDDNAVQINLSTSRKRKLRRKVNKPITSTQSPSKTPAKSSPKSSAKHSQSLSQLQPIIWEWQENDNSYKSYNPQDSNIIENAIVGVKTNLNNSYEVIKQDKDSGIQTNLQTGKQRRIRKQGSDTSKTKSKSSSSSSDQNISQTSNTSNISSPPKRKAVSSDFDSTDATNFASTYKTLSTLQTLKRVEQEMDDIKEKDTKTIIWEWRENDGTFKKYSDAIIKQIEQAKIGETVTIDSTYSVAKSDQSNATQTNTKTKTTRLCRRRTVNDDLDTKNSKEYQDLLQKFQKLEAQLQVLHDVVWEWQDDDSTWKSYTDNNFIKNLEQTILNEAVPLTINGTQQFVVKYDDNNGEQKDPTTGKSRKVRRKILNKKNELEFPDWWIVAATAPTDCFVKVPDMTTHPLAKKAIQDFHKTVSSADFEVLEVYVVQNLHTWAQHQTLETSWLNSKRITKNSLNIRWMWHGSYAKTIPEICSKGFLRDYNSAHLYGKGVYFARDAQYPVGRGYARFDDDKGYAHLLYCRVICGESAIGKQDLVRPPSKATSNSGIILEYETLVDQMVDPSIVVCCTDCQAYPALKLILKRKKAQT